MASSFPGLLSQVRISRSESRGASKSLAISMQDLDATGDANQYPGSLNRYHSSNPAVQQYRSMLDIDTPTLRPIYVDPEGSMENWVSGKLSQTTQRNRTEIWTDIFCFYTASNGAALAAPTRASPAPVPNGKAVPPQEIPQSVISTDPKIAAQQASDMRNIVRRKLTGYVGFANLPNQWHRKSVRKGFNFNVMVVGMYKLFSLTDSTLIIHR